MKTRFSAVCRVLCLMLVLVVSLALFAGCKGEDKTTSSKDAASNNYSGMENTEIVDEFEDKAHPTLPETKDLGGFDMSIATYYPLTVLPEQGTSAEGDLKLEALREVQEAYNCTISVMPVTEWDEAYTTILSGEQYCTVLMPQLHRAGSFVQSRLCTDFLEQEISQYIDMSYPWWNDNMAYASNVLGSVYAGSSSLCAPVDFTWIVYFNKDIVKDIGVGENEFYDLWKKKEWTWDALAKYAKMAVKDLDGSGALDSENDRWGLIGPGYDLSQAFLSTAKIASITTDNGKNPRYTFNTSHAISGMTRLNAFYTTDGFFRNHTLRRIGDGWEIFTEGKSLFVAYMFHSVSLDRLRNMDSEWGILPMPLGMKEGGGWQDKYLSRVDHNSGALIIPSTTEDKASTALVLEAISYSYFRIINQEVETIALTYLSDDTSIEIANTVYNTTTYEISQFFYSVANNGWVSSVEHLAGKIVTNPNFDVSGNTNAVAEQAQQMIDDYFNGI